MQLQAADKNTFEHNWGGGSWFKSYCETYRADVPKHFYGA